MISITGLTGLHHWWLYVIYYSMPLATAAKSQCLIISNLLEQQNITIDEK